MVIDETDRAAIAEVQLALNTCSTRDAGIIDTRDGLLPAVMRLPRVRRGVLELVHKSCCRHCHKEFARFQQL